ncbi:MAG: exopolysaccharide biosynthesis protein [Rhodospirillaceae bacterium]|nr:exopolysaccharide biosynthesis protein [Rhodospirillaceae bacterium]
MSGTYDADALSLEEVTDRIREAAEDGDTVSVDDVMDAIGRRAFGPLILVFALIAFAPVIGSIPGVSIVTGTVIILIAGQMLLQRGSPWIPGFLLRLRIGSEAVKTAMDKVRPAVRRVDRLLASRWRALVKPPWTHVTALVCVVMAAMMYPMAIVPWGVTAPSFALIVLSLGVTAHDGLLSAIGWALALGTLALGAVLLV